MLSTRTFLFICMSCWLISIPIMLLELDKYHPEHPSDHAGCQQCRFGFSRSATGAGLKNWMYQPDRKRSTKREVWPSVNETSDRILEQLQLNETDGTSIKLILLWSHFRDVKRGDENKVLEDCPVQQCEFTHLKVRAPDADVIIGTEASLMQYQRMFGDTYKPHQALVWYQLESPYNGPIPKPMVTINWTATYRRDSTLTAPYGKFVCDMDKIQPTTKNHAEGKTKKVAWFVSNCNSKNGRLYYAQELKKYIDVDVYGMCGRLKCSRNKDQECMEMVNRDYKFYLSFENSNCKDYITEKFYRNGLSNDIVPIVMGAHPDDYAAVAPPHSYIHVDNFESPRELAMYLHQLDHNDTLYNEYFQWKSATHTVDTKFWCRLCALIHESHLSGAQTWHDDLEHWWKGPGKCQSDMTYKPSRWSSWNRADIQANDHNSKNDRLEYLKGLIQNKHSILGKSQKL